MTSSGSPVGPRRGGRKSTRSRPAAGHAFSDRQTTAQMVGIAMLGAVVLEMVGGAIEALTQPARPISAAGQIGGLSVKVPALSINLSDRLAIFARSGASLTVALVLLVATAAIAASRRRPEASGHDARRGKVLLSVSTVLAMVATLANLAVGIEILRNAPGIFNGIGQTNRAAGLLQTFAPMAPALAVLCWAGRRSTVPDLTRAADAMSE
jgi:hypothetical protein